MISVKKATKNAFAIEIANAFFVFGFVSNPESENRKINALRIKKPFFVCLKFICNHVNQQMIHLPLEVITFKRTCIDIIHSSLLHVC